MMREWVLRFHYYLLYPIKFANSMCTLYVIDLVTSGLFRGQMRQNAQHTEGRQTSYMYADGNNNLFIRAVNPTRGSGD